MILSRLVWMQLRSYNIAPSFDHRLALHYLTFSGQGGCTNEEKLDDIFSQGGKNQEFSQDSSNFLWFIQPFSILNMSLLCKVKNPRNFIVFSHWSYIVLIILASLFLSRFLSGSWFLAIVVGTALMSRGAILARIGSLSEILPSSTLFIFWITCVIHYMRTLSSISLYSGMLLIILGTSINGSFILLSLCLPLFCLHAKNTKSRQTPGIKQKKCAETRGIFKAIRIPFSHWIRSNNSNIRIGFQYSTLLLALMISKILFNLFSFSNSFNHINLFAKNLIPALDINRIITYHKIWVSNILQPVDLHYLGSLVLLGASLVKNKKFGFTYLHDANKIVLLSLIILAMGSWGLEMLQLFWLEHHHQKPLEDFFTHFNLEGSFLMWTEPTILSLGIVTLFQYLSPSTR